MPVSDIRYKSQTEASTRAIAVGIIAPTYAKDARGWYIATGTLPGDLGLTVNDVIPTTEVPNAEPKPERAPRGNQDGPVHRVRAWVRDNPTATKEEAVAHFADLNAATVKIQMRKVRLGLV